MPVRLKSRILGRYLVNIVILISKLYIFYLKSVNFEMKITKIQIKLNIIIVDTFLWFLSKNEYFSRKFDKIVILRLVSLYLEMGVAFESSEFSVEKSIVNNQIKMIFSNRVWPWSFKSQKIQKNRSDVIQTAVRVNTTF